MAAAEHPRFVAALTQELYGAYLVGWRPFGEDPNLRQLGAANMVYRGCVAACAPPPPQPVVAPSKGPGAQAQVIEQGCLVKLNLTVDPWREDIRLVMTQAELESAYRLLRPFLAALWAALHQEGSHAPRDTVWVKQLATSLRWILILLHRNGGTLERGATGTYHNCHRRKPLGIGCRAYCQWRG
eukprot:5004200-Amphidinium_carterae.1